MRAQQQPPQVVAPSSDVSVFIRSRPILRDERERGEDAKNAAAPPMVVDDVRQTVTIQRGHKNRPTYGPFFRVFTERDDNRSVFDTAVGPLVGTALAGGVAACFCYGHTGAGKTHTIMGYNGELGMYGLALHGLFATAPRGASASASGAKLVSLRFAEMYNDKFYDLLDGRAECDVREDADGDVHIRSKPIVHKDGSVEMKSMRPRVATSAVEAIAAITKANDLRAKGSSITHSRSSRSHAVLVLEVVDSAIVALRERLWAEEAKLVPIGSVRDSLLMVIQASMMRGVAPEKADEDSYNAQQQLFDAQEAIVNAAKDALAAYEAGVHATNPSIGGTMVFVDLAGAEHGNGPALPQTSAQERRERISINGSLMALKECIRAMGLNASRAGAVGTAKSTAARRTSGAAAMDRVPFRNSKLTVLLKKYLTAHGRGGDGAGCRTVMIANVCGAEKQRFMSANTLQYAHLVLDAADQ